uniref:Protein DCL, chloroplastic n=1 Tax=Oryza meridionalis TaxID=40149 RepID=A0A0E0CRW8_9ORYZ
MHPMAVAVAAAAAAVSCPRLVPGRIPLSAASVAVARGRGCGVAVRARGQSAATPDPAAILRRPAVVTTAAAEEEEEEEGEGEGESEAESSPGGGSGEDETPEEGRRKGPEREWVDWEDLILEDTVPLVGFVRMILHSGNGVVPRLEQAVAHAVRNIGRTARPAAVHGGPGAGGGSAQHGRRWRRGTGLPAAVHGGLVQAVAMHGTDGGGARRAGCRWRRGKARAQATAGGMPCGLWYENGDRLSPEHEKAILERLLPYHPQYEKKIGCGIDYLTVGLHPEFENSRCLFIVRKDGEQVDFSFWKCIKGLIRQKYPMYADSFILRHFRRRQDYRISDS